MPNNRAGLLPPRLLGTGLEIFTSSGSSHYYPFGCQLRIDVEFFQFLFFAALAIRDCRLLTIVVGKIRNRSYLWVSYLHNKQSLLLS